MKKISKNFSFKSYLYSDHAVLRMFERNITEEEIQQVIDFGEVIEEYPKAKPNPAYLIFKLSKKRPLHIVIGINKSKNECTIITLYEPDLTKFENDFKTRKLK